MRSAQGIVGGKGRPRGRSASSLGSQIYPIEEDLLGRVRELDSFLTETSEDLEVDRMAGLAVRLKIRDQHMIHRLEVERRISEDHEKAPSEASFLV